MTGKFTNFLFTIAVNTCNDHLKKKKLYISEYDEAKIECEPNLPETKYIQSEEYQVLYKRLLALPDIQKEALILHYYHGLKIKDISLITGASASTVKSRMKQGIAKLKKIYQQESCD